MSLTNFSEPVQTHLAKKQGTTSSQVNGFVALTGFYATNPFHYIYTIGLINNAKNATSALLTVLSKNKYSVNKYVTNPNRLGDVIDMLERANRYDLIKQIVSLLSFNTTASASAIAYNKSIGLPSPALTLEDTLWIPLGAKFIGDYKTLISQIQVKLPITAII